MGFGRFGSRLSGRGTALGALLLALAATLLWSAAAFAKPVATITGVFGDSCRDFSAHSTKDISHVEIRYADRPPVKDETIASPHYAIDGGPGDEIDSVIVKSGTMSETFDDCPATNSPPTAILELAVPEGCVLVDPADAWHCPAGASAPRTEWLSAAAVGLGCFGDASLCDFSLTFRGSTSTDPDNDIVSWSLDFGDGTSTSGDWTTNTPTGEQSASACCSRTVTLTVMDSAGQSDSDTMTVTFTLED